MYLSLLSWSTEVVGIGMNTNKPDHVSSRGFIRSSQGYTLQSWWITVGLDLGNQAKAGVAPDSLLSHFAFYMIWKKVSGSVEDTQSWPLVSITTWTGKCCVSEVGPSSISPPPSTVFVLGQYHLPWSVAFVQIARGSLPVEPFPV